MPTTITQQQIGDLADKLTAIGSRLEAAPTFFFNRVERSDWHTIAQAAAMLESIRLGLATVELPHFYGIDLAAGPDQTARRIVHA